MSDIILPMSPAVNIRSTRQSSLRCGEWALIIGVSWVRDRPCYVVRFIDGFIDQWVISDDSGYEFRKGSA